MIAHTPGKWVAFKMADDTKFNRDTATVAIVGDWVVARDGPSYDFHGADHDDARLIAAAPELYEALRDLLSDCQHARAKGYRSEFMQRASEDKASAVLAKVSA